MIFLSYKAGAGSFYAKRIADRLEGWGGECFYFERDCKTPDMANKNWWDKVVATVIERDASAMVLIVTGGVVESDPEEENHYVWREVKYVEMTNPEVFNKRLIVLVDNDTVAVDKSFKNLPSWIKVLMAKSQFVFSGNDKEGAIDEVCARLAEWGRLERFVENSEFLTTEGAELKKFNGGISTLRIPRIIRKIADTAFFESAEIEQVLMDETNINTIGQSAFYGCTRLSEVRLPAGLRRVKRYAFKGAPCAVTKDGLTIVDGRLLTLCTAGGDVVLPDSVTCIADEAFAFNFDIKSVRGAGVKYIGENAFVGCKKLEKKDFPLAEQAEI